MATLQTTVEVLKVYQGAGADIDPHKNDQRGLGGYPRPRDADLPHSIDEITQSELMQSPFPAVFFLDRDVFYHGQLNFPKGDLVTPSDVLEIIGNSANIRDIAFQYFATIHRWMPIISKYTFYEQLSSSPSKTPADINLLLLCIHLITDTPPASSRSSKTTEYLAAKRLYLQAETTGTFTVQVLQAGILIALYELGHGIYPSAYLSIGSCARYGIALGLDKETTSHATRPITWCEVEERRRVW